MKVPNALFQEVPVLARYLQQRCLTRLNGEVGHIEKTLLSAFILYMVLNYMTLHPITAEWQQAATGLLVLAAIVLDRFAPRKYA